MPLNVAFGQTNGQSLVEYLKAGFRVFRFFLGFAGFLMFLGVFPGFLGLFRLRVCFFEEDFPACFRDLGQEARRDLKAARGIGLGFRAFRV